MSLDVEIFPDKMEKIILNFHQYALGCMSFAGRHPMGDTRMHAVLSWETKFHTLSVWQFGRWRRPVIGFDWPGSFIKRSAGCCCCQLLLPLLGTGKSACCSPNVFEDMCKFHQNSVTCQILSVKVLPYGLGLGIYAHLFFRSPADAVWTSRAIAIWD